MNINNLFYQNVKTIIDCVEYITQFLNCEQDLKKVLQDLIKKIISNAHAANLLVKNSKLDEAEIILRSALEGTVQLTYLALNPEKLQTYLEDCNILSIRNDFINWKTTIDGEVNELTELPVSKDAIRQAAEENFNLYAPVVQQRILSGCGINEYILNEENYPKINSYFQKFKPEHQKLHTMFSAIDSKNFKLGNFSLKDTTNYYYNISSQTAHGTLYTYHALDHNKGRRLFYLYMIFVQVVPMMKLQLKSYICVPHSKELKNTYNRMKQAKEKLEEIFSKTINEMKEEQLRSLNRTKA